jgi:hypothetical protein
MTRHYRLWSIQLSVTNQKVEFSLDSAEVSEQVASRDLKLLVDHGLLVGEGEIRERIYQASPMLKNVYLKNYEPRTNVDPFVQSALPFPEYLGAPANPQKLL